MEAVPDTHDPDRTVMPALLDACPSFRTAWDAHIADWPDTAERGVYTDVADFAHHLVDLLERDEIKEFEAVFGTSSSAC